MADAIGWLLRPLKWFFAQFDRLCALSPTSQKLRGEVLALTEKMTAMHKEHLEFIEAHSRAAEFDSQKHHYKLKDFGAQTFAYVPDSPEDSEEPEHCLCAHCYKQHQHSILQYCGETAYKQKLYRCPACSNHFTLGAAQKPYRPPRAEMFPPRI